MMLEGNNFDCLLAMSPSCAQGHYVMLYFNAQIEWSVQVDVLFTVIYFLQNN